MDLINFAEEHWTFIVGTLSIIIGYAKLQFSVTDLSRRDVAIEKRLCAVELSVEKSVRDNSKDLTELKVAVARIEATLIGLHEAINEMK